MAGKFAMVEQVRIEHVDEHAVTFTTRSASKSGDRDECLRRRFTCPISEVCTQPITGAPPPVAMHPGAVGHLFLSSGGWDTESQDGYKIYGAGTPLARIKWPDNAAITEFLGDLMIIPSSIVIHGTLDGQSQFFDIELLGLDGAAAQHIAWNGADPIKVQLTPRGAKHLQVAGTVAEVWPTKITIAGKPEIDPTVSGSVDILDNERAGLTQQFKFSRHGEPIRLSLTQDGFAAFHVIPGMPARRISKHG